MHIENCK